MNKIINIDASLVDIGSIEQRTIYLADWKMELTVLFTNLGPFFVIRQLCGALGLVDVARQTGRLKEHRVLSRLVTPLPVKTVTRGRQVMKCIHRRGIGFWWGSIQIDNVREEAQEKLLDLQELIVDLSDRAMFGEVDSTTIRVEHLEDYTVFLEKRVGYLESRLGHIDGIIDVSDEE